MMERHRACDLADDRHPPSARTTRPWFWVRAGAPCSALVLATSLLAGCGSSPAATAAAPSTCQQVSAALADGPDPDADPVGYAEAQVLPLRQIHTSGRLEDALRGLSAAYQRFVDTNGSAAAKQSVAKAGDAVNALCPGATS